MGLKRTSMSSVSGQGAGRGPSPPSRAWGHPGEVWGPPCCLLPFTFYSPMGSCSPRCPGIPGCEGVPAHLPHGDTPIFLSQEDVFIQQTQDTKNPIIYAVFSASG